MDISYIKIWEDEISSKIFEQYEQMEHSVLCEQDGDIRCLLFYTISINDVPSDKLE
jgi:hypothetical protein